MTTEGLLRRAARGRTVLLVAASICCLIMCVGFVDPHSPANEAQALLATFGGLRTWAILYGVAGVAGLVLAALGCSGRWIILGISALFAAWGFAYLLVWVTGLQPRGYLTASWFLTMHILLASLLILPARRTCRAVRGG